MTVSVLTKSYVFCHALIVKRRRELNRRTRKKEISEKALGKRVGNNQHNIIKYYETCKF